MLNIHPKTILRSLTLSMALALSLSACNQNNPVANTPDALHSGDFEVEFTVKVENISNGSALPTPLAPVVWVVDDAEGVIFAEDRAASAGLESLAEDGSPEALAAELNGKKNGHFEAPLAPGESSSFSFKAKPGSKLSFAGMMVESNDVFVAPSAEHIDLFSAANEPRAAGALSLALWDAGTEVNQEPGQGSDQAPRQAAPNTGAAENGNVKHLDEVNDGFSYPEAAQLFRITLSHDHEHDHEHEGEHAHEEHSHADDDHDHDHE